MKSGTKTAQNYCSHNCVSSSSWRREQLTVWGRLPLGVTRVVFARIMSRAVVFICGISNRHLIITASLHTYSQQYTVKIPTSTRRRNQVPDFATLIFASFGRYLNLIKVPKSSKTCHVLMSLLCGNRSQCCVFPTCHVSESCWPFPGFER